MTLDDLKMLLFFAGFVGSVFCAGFWLMRNIARVIDDRIEGVAARFDGIENRLEDLEEKSEQSRNRLYRHIDEKWAELFVLISALDQKFVSKETFEATCKSTDLMQAGIDRIADVLHQRADSLADAVALMARSLKRPAAAPFLQDEALFDQ